MVVKTVALALAANYGVHMATALAYGKLCVPGTIWDIAQSLVSTASPVCTMLLNTMSLTQNNYALAFTTTIAASLAAVVKP